MKSSRKHTSKKRSRLFIGILIVLLVAALCSAFAYYNKYRPDGSSTNNVSNQKPQGSDNPDSGNVGNDTPKPEGNKTPDNNTVDESADTGGITITTPTEGTVIRPGDTLSIRVLIEQTGTGTCNLILSKDSQSPVTRTAPIQSDAQSATCQGFDVATSELSNGIWKAVISVDINGKTLQASRDITIGS